MRTMPIHTNDSYSSSITMSLNENIEFLSTKLPKSTQSTVVRLQMAILPRLKEFEESLKKTTANRNGTFAEQSLYVLERVSEKSGVPVVYICSASGIAISLVLFRILKRFMVNIVVDSVFLLYPIVKTIQSIESSQPDILTDNSAAQENNVKSKERDVMWKSYWILYALIRSFETRYRGITQFIPFRNTLVIYYDKFEFC